MSTESILTFLAIVLAPIIALRIQRYLDDRKEKKNRKLLIFKTLMTTRATPLDPRHVEALNMIDLEFYGNREVIDAWKLLLDSYTSFPQDTADPTFNIKLNQSIEKSQDLFIDLLNKMGKALGYSFDQVHLKRNAYIPKWLAEGSMEIGIIRKQLANLLSGKSYLNINIIDNPK